MVREHLFVYTILALSILGFMAFLWCGASKNATKKKKLICYLSSFACVILFFIIAFVASPSQKATDSTSDDPVSENVMQSSIDMETQLQSIGLTADEATQVAQIFTNVGITQIDSIKTGLGTGIDDLQSYVGYCFGYTNVSTVFTFDKRRLCYIGFTFPDYDEKIYISLTGKVKVKSEPSKQTVVMYDMLNDNTGEFDSSRKGYVAKLDWEAKTITNY